MKSLRAVLAACALAAAMPLQAHAQTYAMDRGSLVLGGQVSFTSYGPGDEGAWSELILTPSVHYFVVPGLSIGAFGALRRVDPPAGDAITGQYGGGAQVSYYFGGPGRAWYPYVSGAAGVHRHRTAGRTTVEYSAAGGVVLMLSRAVGLNGQLYYSMGRGESDDGARMDTESFGFALGVSAFVF